MAYFYGYSFVTVAIPLILGLLFLWFGKKLWNRAGKRNEEYRQRYTGHTTLRVIRVVKHEREEHDSNEQAAEAAFGVCYALGYEGLLLTM